MSPKNQLLQELHWDGNVFSIMFNSYSGRNPSIHQKTDQNAMQLQRRTFFCLKDPQQHTKTVDRVPQRNCLKNLMTDGQLHWTYWFEEKPHRDCIYLGSELILELVSDHESGDTILKMWFGNMFVGLNWQKKKPKYSCMLFVGIILFVLRSFFFLWIRPLTNRLTNYDMMMIADPEAFSPRAARIVLLLFPPHFAGCPK